MSLKIYNISKGELEEEKVCAEKLMRFLYGGKMGEAALWLLISRGIFSKACGLWADSKISRKAVERFIRENEIETSEMLKEPGEYNTFYACAEKRGEENRAFRRKECGFVSVRRSAFIGEGDRRKRLFLCEGAAF